MRRRNVVTNVIGGPNPGVYAEIHKVRLADGDLLLLCSDGLTEPVDDPTIAAILAAAPRARGRLPAPAGGGAGPRRARQCDRRRGPLHHPIGRGVRPDPIHHRSRTSCSRMWNGPSLPP